MVAMVNPIQKNLVKKIMVSQFPPYYLGYFEGAKPYNLERRRNSEGSDSNKNLCIKKLGCY